MPVITKDILRDRIVVPVDGHAKWVDGRPLFGASKTFRGVFFSVLATSLCAALLGLSWKMGVLLASVAMAGDLLSSFLKRRLNLPEGAKATGLDQVPESLFPLLACQHALSLTVLDIILTVALFFAGELLLSRLLYRFRLRDHPY